MDPRIEDFLDKAVEGLRDDEELRRETRSELATHAEEKLTELKAEGKADGEAVEETIRSLGEVVEIAGDLHNANRGRMNLRAQARIVLRFALVPLAIVAALWAADWPGLRRTAQQMSTLRDISGGAPSYDFEPRKRLSDQDQLILYGDRSRTNEVEQQKAIWESDPTNRVYFANYFGHAVAGKDDLSDVDPSLFEEARRIDPDNALYVYLQGLHVLGNVSPDSASVASADAAIVLHASERSSEDAPPPAPSYEVLDRERLDRGMTLIERALGMDRFNTYESDLLEERLHILGRPDRMMELVQRQALSASTLVVYLQPLRRVSELLPAYGHVLLVEGDTGHAAHFLNGWEPLAQHVTDDAHFLIGVLVAGAIEKRGGSQSAAVYRGAGMEEEAQRIQARTDAAFSPMARWREAREAFEGGDFDEQVSRRAGALAGVLLPALGESVPEAAFGPSRRLEYTVGAEGAVGLVTLLLFGMMAACLLVTLRWRFAKGGRAIPVLLLPGWRAMGRAVLLGVVLPGALFLLITRTVPISGHAFSFRVAGHKLIAEFGLLTLALLGLPAWLSARAVRRRCVVLGLPVPAPSARWPYWMVWVGCVVLVGVWLLPVSGLPARSITAGIALGVAGLGLAVLGLRPFFKGLFGRAGQGLYFGTLHRSLIPMLAAAVVVLSLASRPVLHASEAAYIREDTLMDTMETGFTAIERRVTERLRGEMLAALDALEATREAR